MQISLPIDIQILAFRVVHRLVEIATTDFLLQLQDFAPLILLVEFTKPISKASEISIEFIQLIL